MTPELMALAGCGPGDMAALLRGLGYRGRKDKNGVVQFRHQDRVRAKAKPAKAGKKQKPKSKSRTKNSPFDKLNGLTVAR